MDVFINDEKQVLSDTCSIEQMLRDLNIDASGLAVAIDQNVISKTKWREQMILPHQKIILIRATQGG